LLVKAEDDAVEFKSTVRWNLRDQCRDKRMEDAVVKTVAGFLNAFGGTLLIGVDDDGQVLGLAPDYECVKPPNADGFVNWLTTHLINAMGHAATMRIRIRIDESCGPQLCRLDVAQSSAPVHTKTSTAESVFFVRMNNSTREMPADEAELYAREHWTRTP
jgi:type I restriction enzyme R subunit